MNEGKKSFCESVNEKPTINVLLLINRMSKVMKNTDFQDFCNEIENYIVGGHSLIQAYALALTKYAESSY